MSKTYRLLHKFGHYLSDQYPAGTLVQGKPYPADNRYLEITLPDGIRLTVEEGYDVELVEEPEGYEGPGRELEMWREDDRSTQAKGENMKRYRVNTIHGVLAATHYTLNDSEGGLLAWFPIEKGGAYEAASRLQRETGHRIHAAVWTGKTWGTSWPKDGQQPGDDTPITRDDFHAAIPPTTDR